MPNKRCLEWRRNNKQHLVSSLFNHLLNGSWKHGTSRSTMFASDTLTYFLIRNWNLWTRDWMVCEVWYDRGNVTMDTIYCCSQHSTQHIADTVGPAKQLLTAPAAWVTSWPGLPCFTEKVLVFWLTLLSPWFKTDNTLCHVPLWKEPCLLSIPISLGDYWFLAPSAGFLSLSGARERLETLHRWLVRAVCWFPFPRTYTWGGRRRLCPFQSSRENNFSPENTGKLKGGSRELERLGWWDVGKFNGSNW